MKMENLIIKIVNRYIGVEGGYLGDFSYRTHREFYPEYCDLVKDPDAIEGTTRERFINIFLSASPQERAKIIHGVIERFPVGKGPETRTMSLRKLLSCEAEKLASLNFIDNPELEINSEMVFEILEDADSLIMNRKATSAVDRVHTAFHGYLRNACKEIGIQVNEKDDLVALLKKLFENHPKLKISIRSQDIRNLVKNFASISDSLNPIRNRGSRAHPNEEVLDEPEAVLVVNTIRTILIYLDSKIK